MSAEDRDTFSFEEIYQDCEHRQVTIQTYICSDEGQLGLQMKPDVDKFTFDIRVCDASYKETIESYGLPFKALANFVDSVRTYQKAEGK